MQLTIMGQVFECSGAQNRNDAKKMCASAAIEYFEKQGEPFFVNRTRNYTALVFTLCQLANWDPPTWDMFSGISPGMYGCNCVVNGKPYTALEENRKKIVVKEEASKQQNHPTLRAPTDAVPAAIGYEEQLKRMAEADPALGKPFFNFRPATMPDGVTPGYKAQVILGAHSKVSSVCSSQAEAAELAAKELCAALGADTKASQPYSAAIATAGPDPLQSKRKRLEEDDGYVSDETGTIPSYEMLVSKQCAAYGIPNPTFYYVPGEVGLLCVGQLLVPSSGRLETFTSLREHKYQTTAREDVCHDLYILLRSQAPPASS
ncbi:hypothetical protein HDU91_003615 [Kappamyces sp. JEL0680]|nr:hypothetical protein HDU91_003615 [Kappamyces sp. JEL0680]